MSPPRFTDHLLVRLTLAFLLVVAIPAAIVSVYNLNMVARFALRDARASAARDIENAVSMMDNMHGRLAGEIASLAQGPDFYLFKDAGCDDSLYAMVSRIRSFLRSSAVRFNSAAMVGVDGRLLCRVFYDQDGRQIVEYRENINLVAEPFFAGAVHVNAIRGELAPVFAWLSPPEGSTLVDATSVHFSVQVSGVDGFVTGVLVFTVPIAEYFSAITTLHEHDMVIVDDSLRKVFSRLSDGVNAADKLNHLMRHGSADISAEYAGSFIIREEPAVLAAFHQLMPPGQSGVRLTVFFLHPLSGILAPVRHTQSIIIFATIISFMLVILLVYLFTHNMIKPLERLADSARAVSRGKWETPLLVTHGSYEIQELISAFRDMLVQLKASHQQLQDKITEINQINATLETTVSDRTSDLVETNKELEAFCYSVSHDLRAPLRSIEGFALAIEDDYGESMPDESMEYLKRVRAAAKRMGQLIDDLLKLSRVRKTEIIRNDLNLSRLAEEVVDSLRRQYPDHNVNIQIEADIMVRADQALARTVLENLLGNAWKFTCNCDSPNVMVKQLEYKGLQSVCISDNGIGFDMQYAGKLFKPFSRLVASRDYEGCGIGLVSVDRILQRHGGWIQAEGELGKGAAFYFSFGD